jgi:hypothetical protein
MSTTPVTKPVHFDNRDIVFETGGVKFVMHVTADMSGTPAPSPNPTPNPTPTPAPTPQPTEGGIALDGVKMLFPVNHSLSTLIILMKTITYLLILTVLKHTSLRNLLTRMV